MLPDPSTVRSQPPPPGHRWVWVKEDTDGYLAWRVLTDTEGESHRCRWSENRERCPNRSVVKFKRSVRQERWYHYCEHHMYGRVLHDGAVWSLRALPTKENDSG